MRASDRRPDGDASTPTGVRAPRRRLALLLACAAVGMALMAVAPGAMASTLTFSGGTLTYQAANGSQTEVYFGQSAANAANVEVRTYTTDPITGPVPANCTSTPPTVSNGATAPGSDYTCTGVGSVIANAGDTAATMVGMGDQRGGVTPSINPLSVPITENGSPQADQLTGGDGNDTLNGNGNSQLNDSSTAYNNNIQYLDGGPGSDTLNGGSGASALYGDGASDGNTVSPFGNNDTINADNGNAQIYPSNGTNHINGGSGITTVYYYDNAYVPATGGGPGSYAATPVTVDLTGAADSGYAGNKSVLAPNITNAEVDDSNNSTCTQLVNGGSATSCAYGNATIVGNNLPNSLIGGSGNDTITAGKNGDYISGNAGSNTINAVNGYPDRVDCGGIGTANVDQLDSVFNCTTTNRQTLSNTGLLTQDKAPTITWTAPAENAKLPYGKASTLTATVTPGDHPVTQVLFYVGEREVCDVKAPPYTCSYTPTSGDVGRDTLLAIAQDSIGLTNSAARTVTVAAPPKYNGSISLRGGTLAVHKNKVSFKLKCASTKACTERISIDIRARLKGSKKVATILFTKSSNGAKTIKAGKTATITETVSPAGLSLLKKARHHRMTAKLSTKPRTAQRGIVKTVTLVLK